MSEIPFQVEHLIKNLLDKRDNIYVRGNFRSRLLTVKEAIEGALKEYEKELFEHSTPRKK